MVYVSFCYMGKFIEAIFKIPDYDIVITSYDSLKRDIEIYEENYKTYNNEELISYFGKNFIFF